MWWWGVLVPAWFAVRPVASLRRVGVSIRGGSGPEWRALEAHAQAMASVHLRELLSDDVRCASLALFDGPCGLALDWSRQKVTAETMRLLFE